MQRLLFSAVTLASALALASSIVPRSLGEQARVADRVVLAEVIDSAVHVPEGDVRHMTTLTNLAVREELKGHGPDRVQVVQLGGKSGEWELHVPDDATFQAGETVVVFLRCRDRAHPERCTLLGLTLAKVPVVAGQGGHDALVPRLGAQHRRRTLESLEDEVRRAGREVAR
jgi:hypothetical protein